MKIVLSPTGQVVEAQTDKTLLDQLREAGVYIKSSCGGHATCRDCVVKVNTGQDQLTPPTFEEMRLLGNVFHITKERLACQTKVTGTVTLDISAHDKSKDQDQLQHRSTKMKTKKMQNSVIRRSVQDQKDRLDNNSKENADGSSTGTTTVDEDKKFPQGGFKRPKGLSYPKKKPGRY
jgi:ferredoxin